MLNKLSNKLPKVSYTRLFSLSIILGECIEQEIDYNGNDLNINKDDIDWANGPGKRDSAEKCQQLCQNRAECNFFTYVPSRKVCLLKTSDSGRLTNRADRIAGKKYCGNDDII